MNIKQAFKQLFHQPSIQELEARELDDMQRQLLEVKRNEEYYRNMGYALEEGIGRLLQKRTPFINLNSDPYKEI